MTPNPPNPTPPANGAVARLVATPLAPSTALPDTRVVPFGGAPLAGAPVNPATHPLLAILQALQRRWLVAAAIGLAMMGLTALFAWFVMPPSKYIGRAMLHIEMMPQGVVDPRHQDIHGSRELFANYQRTQIAMVKSRPVLRAALKEPEVAELSLVREQGDPVGWLEAVILVDFSVAPEIMRVSMRGDRPQELALLVNAIVKAYLREIVNKEHHERTAELVQANQILSKYEEKLRGKRDQLRKLQEAAGSGNEKTLEIIYRGYQDQLAQAKKERIHYQSELRRVTVDIALLESREKELLLLQTDAGAESPGDPPTPNPLSRVLSEATIEQRMQEDTMYRDKMRAIRLLEQDLDEYTSLLKPDLSPQRREELLKPRKDKLAAARREASDLRRRLRPEIVRQLRSELLAQTQAALSQLQTKKEQYVGLEKQLAEHEQDLEKLIKSFKKNQVDVKWLESEITDDELLAKRIAQKRDQLELQKDAPQRVKLFEEAAITPSYDAQKRWLATIGGGLAGLIFSLAGFGWYEYRVRRVYTADEVVQGLNTNVVGALPHVRSRGRLPLSGAQELAGVPWYLRFTESVDSIRTMLLHVARYEPFHTLMVTSAVQGEGKTSLACHLAASLARAGRRTLLIDCDMRRPAVHLVSGATLSPGVAELLRGQRTLAETIQPAHVEGLSILPAGICDPRALQALAQDGLRPILKLARDQFDFVIVDSCPVLPLADSLLTAQQVDAVLFAVMREVSRMPRVHAAFQRLQQLGARILGVVVNGARSGAEYPSYYSSYYTAHPSSAGAALPSGAP
jgi:capsular exopolysaccharide synthesis family protein